MTEPTDKELDIITDTIDELLLNEYYGRVDDLLRNGDIENTHTTSLIAILTATLPAKKYLMDRSEFYDKVKSTIQNRNELEPGLLVGLK